MNNYVVKRGLLIIKEGILNNILIFNSYLIKISPSFKD